jgi:uncharacterized membrane protein
VEKTVEKFGKINVLVSITSMFWYVHYSSLYNNVLVCIRPSLNDFMFAVTRPTHSKHRYCTQYTLRL